MSKSRKKPVSKKTPKTNLPAQEELAVKTEVHLDEKKLQTDSSKNPEENYQKDYKDSSLGEILKINREKLKIEIAQVSSHLRVASKEIVAIENDEIEKVALSVYAPGLIRSYAKFLRIDQKIIEEKIATCSFKSNTKNKKYLLVNIGEHLDLSPSKDSFFNFLLISILLFIVLLSIYGYYESDTDFISNEAIVSELKSFIDKY